MIYVGIPQSGWMETMDALNTWTPQNDPYNRAIITPLRPRPAGSDSSTRLFLYHDMYGGYIPDGDLYPQGTANPNYYDFNFWQYTDIFSYFTHHWLAVPPPAWINAAHRNGVPMLGNLTPPYDDSGAFIQPMLDNPAHFVAQLVGLAQYYGFDGWAFNFETNLLPPGQTNAQKLVAFLQSLTNAIHTAIPGSKIIWYDSVTIDGVLAWQGELNSQNLPFFQACDGIFLDYRWQYMDPTLSTSRKNAGDRPLDVYAGIDVFNNQYDTYQALQTAKTAGVSGGLFAFSWTYQQQTDAEPYHARERKLWLGDPVTYPNLTNCIGSVIDVRPVPQALPFLSNFNTGRGRQFFVAGDRVSAVGTETGDIHWGNMSQQDPLPTWRYRISWGSMTAFTADFSYDTAYDGGSSLLIQSATYNPGDFSVFDLFAAGIPITAPCTLSFTFSQYGTSPLPDMWVILRIANDTDQIILPVSQGPGAWQNFQVDLSKFAGQVIDKIQLKCGVPSGTVPGATIGVYAGELALLDSSAVPAGVQGLVIDNAVFTNSGLGIQSASFDLLWNTPAPDVIYYNIWQVLSPTSRIYLGRAFTNAFRIDGMMFAGTNTVMLGVQPRSANGVYQPLDQMATISLAPSATMAGAVPSQSDTLKSMN